ncbi:acyltransferase family protein [Brevibacillus porteri]|uniref:acyltransferase family protein n=1 Tax=Brevibacillus porteri TaxID=2126350 RepID=UPI00363079CA
MNNRYVELDSLRGLAAISVFLSHMYLIFQETLVSKLIFKFGFLRAFIAGTEAVMLFFILSGFVLSIPFYTKRPFDYGTYVIRRFSRIYIPYIVAIAGAYLLRELFYSGQVDGLTDFFNVIWSNNMNVDALINHIILIGTFTSNINSVVWSLVHEMRISLVFPFIMFFLVRYNWKASLAFAFLLSGISVVYSYITNAEFDGTEVYSTFHYTSLFILGALLAKYREELVNRLTVLSRRKKVILFITGIVLYLYLHPSFVLNVIIDDMKPYYRTVIDSWFISLGASILIMFALLPNRFSNILKKGFLGFLGKISYSLYLTHLTVLMSMVHLLHGIIPLWLICLLTIVVTILVSSLMYYFVERRAINLSNSFKKSNMKKDVIQSKV